MLKLLGGISVTLVTLKRYKLLKWS